MEMIEIRKKEYSYYDFLPVILASLYAGRAGGSFEDWRVGFWIGTALVAVQMLVYRIKKRDIDPFAIGMNVFLFRWGSASFDNSSIYGLGFCQKLFR